jgi:hypothetical protein
MRVFGVDFTDKAVWYLMAIPVSFEKSCGSVSLTLINTTYLNILCKTHTHAFFKCKVLLSNGLGSMVPAACGVFSGSLYTSNIAGVQTWRLPSSLESMLKFVSPYIAGSPPQPQPTPAVRNGGGNGGARPRTGGAPRHGNTDANMAEFMRQSAATPVAPLPPPSEDDILNLMVNMCACVYVRICL